MTTTTQTPPTVSPGRCQACVSKRPASADLVVDRGGQSLQICKACQLPTDLPTAQISREAFRVELDPTNEQDEMFRKHCGLSRFVYNWALWRRREWWDANKDLPKEQRAEQPNAVVLSRRWTKEHPEWSSELARTTVTYALDAVDAAFAAFFDRLKKKQRPYGFPKPKHKGKCRDSFTLQDQSFRFDAREIKIGKIGMVRTKQYVAPTPTTAREVPELVTETITGRDGVVRRRRRTEMKVKGAPAKTRYLEGRVLRIVVSKYNGRWFCSLMVERLRPILEPPNASIVGIDIGLRNVVTTSTGQRMDPSPSIDRVHKRMRKLQRALQRRVPGSKGSAEAQRSIANLHARIADKRGFFLHAVANDLLASHGTIVVEDFDVRDLSSTHGPTRGQPGASDARRKIAQTGLGELRRILEYKARWRGNTLIRVKGATNQICSRCYCRNIHMAERRDSKFSCVSCGHADSTQRNTADLLERIGTGQISVEDPRFGADPTPTSPEEAPTPRPRRSRRKDAPSQ